MPNIHIPLGEKMCCNCQRFEFLHRERRPDSLGSVADSNQGICPVMHRDIKATRRACKNFIARGPENPYLTPMGIRAT